MDFCDLIRIGTYATGIFVWVPLSAHSQILPVQLTLFYHECKKNDRLNMIIGVITSKYKENYIIDKDKWLNIQCENN